MTFRIGIDIGGTFTDIVVLGPDGAVTTSKVPSTPDHYSRGILDALSGLVNGEGINPASIAQVMHDTTVATNAILEGKGAGGFRKRIS